MMQCAAELCHRPQAPLFGRRLAGLTVDGQWFCSVACVATMARERLIHAPAFEHGDDEGLRMRVGAWLVHNGVLTAAQMHHVLETQQHTGLRFGAQVQALGLASADEVLRALAQQAGVRYLSRIDPATVRRGPCGLSRHAVRALGLVPFAEPAHGVLKVACPPPLPRVALAALRRITGLSPQPHLVADDVWPGLVEAYGVDAVEVGSPLSAATTDLGQAAELIADAAAHGRDVRLSETRCDPFIWARVLGPSSVHDVVFAPEGR